jgi:MFS transporter, YNFM family, putative membrane transport protein
MRALVGLSLSGLAAVAMTYLSEEIHPQHIGLAMGLYIGGNAIGGMSGRLISGVLIDFVSWHTAMLVIGGLALAAALVFCENPAPNRATSAPRSLNPRSLLNGFTMHFRDAGLPWLFLEAFLLMGSFVTLFNYIGYRLLADPYNMNQAVVGLLSVVYLSGIYSSATDWRAGRQTGPRRVLWAVIVLMLAGIALTLLSPSRGW